MEGERSGEKLASVPATGAASAPPALHPATRVLGVLIFVLGVAVAAKIGIWAARTQVPDSGTPQESTQLAVGDELKLMKLDNHYVAGEGAGDLRNYIFQKTGSPGLTLADAGLDLLYLDGDVGVRVLRDDSDIALVEILEGRLKGRRVYLEKRQLEGLVP